MYTCICNVIGQWAHQYGEASQEVVDEDNTTDQVCDLQRCLQRLWTINGWPALPLGIFHHYGGDVEFVLVCIVPCLNGEGLEKSDSDADHTHGYTAPYQEQEANAKAQADLCDNKSAVGRVEAVDGVVPAHCWEGGQDEGDHPDAHYCVHCLLLGVTQPEENKKQQIKHEVRFLFCTSVVHNRCLLFEKILSNWMNKITK